MVMGEAADAAVAELQAISGKTKEECMMALRAAFGNPDRAFEFLMANVPIEQLQQLANQQPGAGGQPGDDVEDDYGEEGSADPMGGAGGNPLAALA